MQETVPSRSLGLQRVGGERPCDGRVPEESDEFALSHANLPVEDEAYHRAALCIAAKICRRWQRWVLVVWKRPARLAYRADAGEGLAMP